MFEETENMLSGKEGLAMPKLSKRALMIRRMRELGMTYEQIGDVFGISKQAAHQASMSTDGVRENLIQKVPFIGLRNWMLEQRVTFYTLSDMCGVRISSKTFLGECDPRKKTIDAILRVTGLTYEECFREEKEEKEENNDQN